MPEFKRPGVFVQELTTVATPIVTAPTSTAGFVGLTEWGPTVPQLVKSWEGYSAIFGNHVPDVSYLSYAVEGFFHNGGSRCWVGRIDATTPTVADYRKALDKLAEIEEISLLAAPDEVRAGLRGVSAEIINQCDRLGDRFGIVSAEQHPGSVATLHPPQASDNAAFYHPWIKVFDAKHRGERFVPASGHIAGVFARIDVRGVWKAPANEPINGALDVQHTIGDHDQATLNGRAVNCVRKFPSRGIVIWGARTMSNDANWRYVPVRRLAMMIEASLKNGTRWTVFEPNGEPVWALVRQQANDFMRNLFREGALQGADAKEAFFVRCGRDTMSQVDIDSGRLKLIVGFAPLKPAEFVMLTIEQQTAN